MPQRHHQRRHQHKGLWLVLAGLLLIAVVTLGLIYRGAKVSGPDSATSASHHIRKTTPTVTRTKVNSGTYTAQGKAEDPDGEALTVRVYLRLLANGHYRRELQIRGTTIRRIIDSGTYTSTTKAISLTSLNAVILNYPSTKAMGAGRPQTAVRYGGDHQAYPSYLETVLTNRVALKHGRATSYRYVATKLPLTTSKHTVPSVSAAATELPHQAVQPSRAASSSSSSAALSSSTSQSAEDASATDSEASSSGHESTLSLADAEAIVAVRYPSQRYQISGGTQTGDQFTFVVVATDTHVSQSVTVTADGQLH